MFEQKQFISAVEQICEEKGIRKERVIETVEAALAAAYKRDYAKRGQSIRVDLDEATGDMKVFLIREVVKIDPETNTILEMAPREETAQKQGDPSGQPPVSRQTTEALGAAPHEASAKDASVQEEGKEERQREYNPDRYISFEEAKEYLKEPKLGDSVETSLEPPQDFGRIAAQTAKQVIIQRIREAERESMFEEYQDKVGEVINGSVQRLEGRNVIIDLGRATGVLFPDEQIPREFYTPGQRVKVFLNKIENGVKGPGITLSRACPDFVKELLKMEVPEIASGGVVVQAIAREAGSRTKIAVAAKEEGIDPVGACVGQKGTRIQTVIGEMNGEKIDVIEWAEDPASFIGRALSPAKVLSVELHHEERLAVVSVEKDQLSLAIGRHGQNVRLAAKLTGWKIDVKGIEKSSVEDAQNEEVADENVQGEVVQTDGETSVPNKSAPAEDHTEPQAQVPDEASTQSTQPVDPDTASTREESSPAPALATPGSPATPDDSTTSTTSDNKRSA